jgi:hypothetical protein
LFNSSFEQLLNKLDGINKESMSVVLNRTDSNGLSIETISKRLSNFNSSNYILIEGDANITSKAYVLNNPGARIKLLYMDLDLGEPTYNILKTLWNRVVKGGIIVFDEYGYHNWDESDGVDNFLREIDSTSYDFIDTKIGSPTAYLIKLV